MGASTVSRNSPKLLVSGAAGHLGQRVVAHLLESQNVSPGDLIAGTRNPEKLADLASKGVAVRRLDFEDASSLTQALAGADRMLLISTDAIDRPGRRLTQHRAAVQAAAAAGLQRIVYTSMPHPESSLVTFAPDHCGTEEAIVSSGLGWTILRMNWYMEGLLMSLPTAIATGEWHTAAGDGRVGYVAREDCARAAAAALVSTAGGNQCLDVTGLKAFSAVEVIKVAAGLAHKFLDVVQESGETRRQALAAPGLPEGIVALIVSIEASIRAGKLDVVSDTVTRLTGMPAKTLEQFLAEHRAALMPMK
jgi:NAD(P)H dehydrogenase (quinone)